MLFDPQEHTALHGQPWSALQARSFVVNTVREADAAYDPERLWGLHPEDRYDEQSGPNRGLYSGGAGTMWALTRLAKTYGIDLKNDYGAEAGRCAHNYRSDPYETDGAVAPSYFMGTTGIDAARFAISGDGDALDDLQAGMAANAGNLTHEIFWGSSGSAIGALLVRERGGEARFEGLLRAVQDEFWSAWESESEGTLLWKQDMYGKCQRYVGAGHGAFGNLLPFLRAFDLLPEQQQRELRERIFALLTAYVIRDGDAANWYALGQPLYGNRMQWCHGAPGIIMSLAAYPPGDDRVEHLLLAGGEGIWRAGPVRKGPTLCHGTAGNGYAFLRLAQRSANDLWLQRAQQFAAHAIDQVAQWRAEYGIPSFSLWSGELGVACFIDSVLRADPAIPTLEVM